jgi:alpha-amylase/alpha-mannosidase (GH57 family)
MGRKAVSIHAHYYQPAREDPITGVVPNEEGARPYHNWNEMIHEQCYRPNAELGNFEHISFDIGPTLVNWMISYDPATVSKIVEQERKNYLQFGVGNGMAQPYHHTILPLANYHDKVTQVHWGIADFEHRFGHRPAGLWLPEAAVDHESLEVLVDNGVGFTILALWQAQDADIEVGKPYWVELSSGKRIAVFFYDADLSMRVSFDPAATSNGDLFLSDYLLPKYSTNGKYADEGELLIIASDGELYGHHQPFRDKFLHYLTQWGGIQRQIVKFSYPGRWLLEHPPQQTIKIRDNTSWSCHHGISRWAEPCPCSPHGDWKTQLRKAMNNIAAAVDEQYFGALKDSIPDPWTLLYRYIEVLHGKVSFHDLLKDVFRRAVDQEELQKMDLLLRAQLNKQRMFTSCAWFFDDFDRLEPRFVVVAAAQAVWWTKIATGVDLIPQAREWLGMVRSWRSGLRGDVVFNGHIDRLRYEQLAFPFLQNESERY